MPIKQAKMKPAERRRARRDVLAQKPTGTLKLYIDNQSLDVVRIHDISPFGVCLQLPEVVARGAQVQLKYTVGAGNQTEVSGTVVWQKPVKSPDPNSSGVLGWWVGIYLHPGNSHGNFALYQAVMGDQEDWQIGEFNNTLYW